jgi:catechol 2,3-dioxygenase-like lactoylglutathione lyase family enzyme
MINHITLLVTDLAKSKQFYERALKPLGHRVVYEKPGHAVGFATKDVDGQRDFWLRQASVEQLKQANQKVSSGLHFAFSADSKQQVDDFYAASLNVGGIDNGPPGYRPHYHAGYYAAFVLDPDGNNVEAVFDEPVL